MERQPPLKAAESPCKILGRVWLPGQLEPGPPNVGTRMFGFLVDPSSQAARMQ